MGTWSGAAEKGEKVNNIADDLVKALLDGYAMGKTDAERRRHGKWIPSKEPPWVDCSECGQGSVEYTNFCPNCGADMRGDSEDIPMEYFESGGK